MAASILSQHNVVCNRPHSAERGILSANPQFTQKLAKEHLPLVSNLSYLPETMQADIRNLIEKLKKVI